ncbi:hypothetical protein KJ849_00560 [bacterium]|nr:hypothetical protein [bacterium]
MRTLLALEDGRIFEGTSFGIEGGCSGKVVFNTHLMDISIYKLELMGLV